MPAIRAFIAIDLTPAIRTELSRISSRLKKEIGTAVRWVPSQNIHITLKFLGDVSEVNIELLCHLLKNEASRHQPFELHVGDLSAFPSPSRPRVIWVGVHAPPDLASLQKAIDNETQHLGYASEDKAFSPHLTIGRVSQHATHEEIKRITETLKQTTALSVGAIEVDAICLFRSDLNPEGAQYTRLYTAPLSAPGV